MDAGRLRPLRIGEVVDAAAKVYRIRFWPMLKAVAVVVVPFQVLSFLVALSSPGPGMSGGMFFLGSGTTTTSSSTTSTGDASAALAASLLVMLIGFVSSTLSEATCLKLVEDAYLGGSSSWTASLRFAFSRLGSLVWLGILSGLGLTVGYMFCLVPGVWLYAAWAVAVPALLFENTKGVAALTRSFRLVRRRWWPTAGVLLVAFLVTTLVTFTFAGVLSAVIVSGSGIMTANAANAIATSLAAILTTPFAAAIAAILYFDLRVRREGFDVALMIQGLAPVTGPEPVRPVEGAHAADVPDGTETTTPWTRPGVAPWSDVDAAGGSATRPGSTGDEPDGS